MGGPGGPMGAIGIPLNRLDLTDAQRDQVKSVMDSHQAELRPLGEKAMTARRALERAVTADTVDEGAIRSLRDHDDCSRSSGVSRKDLFCHRVRKGRHYQAGGAGGAGASRR